jgi:hypothetical protein
MTAELNSVIAELGDCQKKFAGFSQRCQAFTVQQASITRVISKKQRRREPFQRELAQLRDSFRESAPPLRAMAESVMVLAQVSEKAAAAIDNAFLPAT